MAKGRKTKLTEDMIEEICGHVKLRSPWSHIAAMVNVDPKTLRNWRDRGMKAKSGIYRDFVKAVDRAEGELYSEVVTVLKEGILGGGTQTIRQVVVENGIPVKTTITEKTLLPNYKLALEFLERSYPELWGRYETLRLETDLRLEIEQLGLNLEQVLAAAAKMVEDLMESDGDPIALLGTIDDQVVVVEPQELPPDPESD